MLVQKGRKRICKWKIVWCSSRALKPAHKGLPPLYLEALGHHWAITDAQYYLKRCRNEFQAVTDHYALLSLTQKPLADLPVKLRDLFLELRGYNYSTIHIAGARKIISNTLCHAVKSAKKKIFNEDDLEEHEEMDYEASGGRELNTKYSI